MENIITTGVSKHCVDGYITLTSYPATQLRRCYHLKGRRGYCLLSISKEQLDILLNYALTERDKVILNLLWHSGMRRSEVANVQA
ncbi:hypothetical protein ACFLUJ_09440, partial [Chloroflexota bacterium]